MPARRGTQLTLTLVSDQLTLKALIASAGELRTVLQEVGKSVSGRSIEWVVQRITHASPATIELYAQDQVHGPDIAKATVRGFSDLEQSAVRPHHFSDRALISATRLANHRSSYAIQDLRIAANGSELWLDEHILANARKIQQASYKEHGMVEGLLMTATIRGQARVYIFDAVHGARVDCKAPAERIMEYGRYLGRRVVVEGPMESDFRGRPLKITIESLEVRDEDDAYPQLDQLIRMEPEIPISTDEFNEYLRGE